MGALLGELWSLDAADGSDWVQGKKGLLPETHLKRKRQTTQRTGGGEWKGEAGEGTSIEFNSQDPAHVCDQSR